MSFIKSNPIPDKFRTDHLFLLVGQNPLPNYVSGLLLTPDDRPSNIYLIHSANTKQPFAEQLKKRLEDKKSQFKIILREVKEADSTQISDKIGHIIRDSHLSGTVGLNYTSGTKPMVIHTYRKLAELLPRATFSYLDARELGMYIDGLSHPFPVGRALDISLEDLAQLHGYTLELKEDSKWQEREKLVQAIARLQQKEEGVHQWNDWLCTGEWPSLEDYDQWRRWQEKRQKRLTELPDPVQYPALKEVRAAMDDLCGGQATPELLARSFGFERLVSTSKWFMGTWLEELALSAVITNIQEFQLKHYAMEVKPKPLSSATNNNPRNFDLDVAVMMGYQLFVISCINSRDPKGETKKHLFEAYTRARQFGGDEARVALVCCVDNPGLVEHELRRDWHAEDQIVVFGRHDLTRLPSQFRNWFRRYSIV